MSSGLWSARLLCPWNSPVKNTEMGCHFLLQGIFPTQEARLCLLGLLHWQVCSLPLVPPTLPYSILLLIETEWPWAFNFDLSWPDWLSANPPCSFPPLDLVIPSMWDDRNIPTPCSCHIVNLKLIIISQSCSVPVSICCCSQLRDGSQIDLLSTLHFSLVEFCTHVVV